MLRQQWFAISMQPTYPQVANNRAENSTVCCHIVNYLYPNCWGIFWIRTIKKWDIYFTYVCRTFSHSNLSYYMLTFKWSFLSGGRTNSTTIWGRHMFGIRNTWPKQRNLPNCINFRRIFPKSVSNSKCWLPRRASSNLRDTTETIFVGNPQETNNYSMYKPCSAIIQQNWAQCHKSLRPA